MRKSRLRRVGELEASRSAASTAGRASAARTTVARALEDDALAIRRNLGRRVVHHDLVARADLDALQVDMGVQAVRASARYRRCRAPRACSAAEPAAPIMASRSRAVSSRAKTSRWSARRPPARCAGRSSDPPATTRHRPSGSAGTAARVPTSCCRRSRASPRSAPRRKPLVPGGNDRDRAAAGRRRRRRRAPSGAILEAQLDASRPALPPARARRRAPLRRGRRRPPPGDSTIRQAAPISGGARGTARDAACRASCPRSWLRRAAAVGTRRCAAARRRRGGRRACTGCAGARAASARARMSATCAASGTPRSIGSGRLRRQGRACGHSNR